MPSAHSRTCVFQCIALLVGLAIHNPKTIVAEEWPRFRGVNGSASSNQAAPTKFSEEDALWSADLDGVGASSPCIWGDRLFVTTSSSDGERRTITCYDVTTGSAKWERHWSFEGNPKHTKNSYATATACADANGVYVTFADEKKYMVYALTHTGKQRWEVNLGPFLGQHGHGASPMVHNDKLIVTNDQDGPSFITALSVDDGATLWKTERISEKAAYSTPFVISADSRELLILSSMRGLTALDMESGKEVWVCDAFDARAVGSPFQSNGLMFAICGSGRKGHLMIAVDPSGEGDVLKSHLRWRTERTLPYCPTPVGKNGSIFLITEGGVARCIRALDGEEIWTQRLQGSFSASPVIAGENLYIVSEDGVIYVLPASPEPGEPIANQLTDHFLATPAFADGNLFLRGEKKLWCFASRRKPDTQ